MIRVLTLFLLSFGIILNVAAQRTHTIKGKVIDKNSRQPLEFINILLIGQDMGAVTNATGEYTIDEVKPGIYKLQASSIGYKTVTTPEYIVSTGSISVNIEMEESTAELQEVSVTASNFRRDAEAPVGLRIIGLQEIEKSPGGNRDISRIVQSYPGVSFSPAGYRNDLIVRGGAPSENRFYLDGIEIPNINHFSTQGASGGPVGIINADLIREVKFFTGALPASRGNALSSVLDFKLRDGSMERNSLKATLGASEVALASNGHLTDKTSYLVSVRQSYLQFLFDMLGLPFLPTFTDAQFKTKTRFDESNELTFLGLVGIDNMRLNTSLTGEDAEYILSYLPKIEQESFTVGSVYKHYAGRHIQSIVLSYNYLNNRNTKYQNNDESSDENLMLRLRSVEQELKLRLENTSSFGRWNLNYGINLDYARYTNNSLQRVYNLDGLYRYATTLNLFKWGFFGTATYTTDNERFTASVGMRADANNYSDEMTQPLKQFSPRLSLSYGLTPQLFISGNVGLYHQLPQYTALGFKNEAGIYLNKSLKYGSVLQSSLGLSWRVGTTIEISAEGFYKKYSDMPFSLADGIPLACKGDDYGVIGNELLLPTAEGRAYGMELLARWEIARKLNVSSSLTIFKSEYRNDKHSGYTPSAWDNRFIFNLSGIYNFPRQWSAGARLKYIGGAPYTPYDVEKSSSVDGWNAQGKPYYDYTLYNTGRLPNYYQLDIRVDKTYYIKRYMLGFYIDLQNITKSMFKEPDILMSTGEIENPEAPKGEQRYKMKYIGQSSGTILPTLGITFEF